MKKIKEYQAANGLAADGIIGPKTLNHMAKTFSIFNPVALGHFLGQVHHESGGFRTAVESLNYSVAGLVSTFKFYRQKRHLAKLHGRKTGQRADQKAIANNVYADENRSARFKLGNDRPGDGWKYRGRGAIQITGKNNYREFFTWLGKGTKIQPELAATTYYWHTALWYFSSRHIWKLCIDTSHDTIKDVSKKINGGYNGLEDRIEQTLHYTELAKKWLKK